MIKNTTFGRPFLALTISALIAFWSSAAFAAPAISHLGPDEMIIAKRLLIEILNERTNQHIADGPAADTNGRVAKMMNAARSKVLEAVQKAQISESLEVQSGTFFSGFIPRRDGQHAEGTRR